MRRIVLSAALTAALMAFAYNADGQRRAPARPPASPQGQTPKTEKARDPVCGLMVDKDPKLAATYKGQLYYFCSRADMEQFKKQPDRYVKR